MHWSLGLAFISSVAIHVGALITLSLAWGWLHVLPPARGLDSTDLVIVTPLVSPPVVPEEPEDRTLSPVITEEPTPLPAMPPVPSTPVTPLKPDPITPPKMIAQPTPRPMDPPSKACTSAKTDTGQEAASGDRS